MLELRTVNDILAGLAERDGDTAAMWKSAEGWKPITARTMYGRVRALVAALESWGLDPVRLQTQSAAAIPDKGGVGWLPQGTVGFGDFVAA